MTLRSGIYTQCARGHMNYDFFTKCQEGGKTATSRMESCELTGDATDRAPTRFGWVGAAVLPAHIRDGDRIRLLDPGHSAENGLGHREGRFSRIQR